jgi:regulator of sigma E protease
MGELINSVWAFLVVIAVLVSVHEYGHYWVACRLGVKVLRFSIGFGTPLYRWQAANGTEFVIAAIPLGGYVKMLDERETDEPIASADLPMAYNRQSVWSRIAIVLAGPGINFVFAILLYWVVFMLGIGGVKPWVGEVLSDSPAWHAGISVDDEIVAVADSQTPTWSAVQETLLSHLLDEPEVELTLRNREQQLRTVILPLTGTEELKPGELLTLIGVRPKTLALPAVLDRVIDQEPAWQSGFLQGDRVVAVSRLEKVGDLCRPPVEIQACQWQPSQEVRNWTHWVNIIRESPGVWLKVNVERDQKEQILWLKPAVKESEGQRIGRIGAAPRVPENYGDEYRVTVHYGPLLAIPAAMEKTWHQSVLTLRVIGRMMIGQMPHQNLSGPVSIAQFAGASANLGITQFIAFMAIVSLSLGVLNLLPIPLLDGGHLVFYLVEVVQGKPVPDKIMEIGQLIGLALLVPVMLLALFNDLMRIYG